VFKSFVKFRLDLIAQAHTHKSFNIDLMVFIEYEFVF